MFKNQTILQNNWQQLNQVFDNYQAKEQLPPYQSQVDSFIMRVPLVGLFSAGKSTLLNKLLNDNLLSVEITPETAMATELYYTESDEKFYGHKSNGEVIELSRSDVFEQNFQKLLDHSNEGSHSWVSAYLNAPVLKKFPHISLVDLPGLESNLASHSQMIDNYIQKSLAYAIVVSIEDGELKSSTQQFLKELKLNQTPVILIVTKSDTKTPSDAQAILAKIEASITNVLGERPLKTVLVSRKSKNYDELVDALTAIESKAENRFDQVVVLPIVQRMDFLSQNLDKLINTDDTNIEQLQAEKELLESEITAFKQKVAKDTERLESKVQGIVNQVSGMVESNLTSQLETLASCVLSQQDISPLIESTVRMTVTEGMQNELVPVIQDYIKNVNAEMPDSLKVDTPSISVDKFEDDGWNFTDIVTTLAPVLALLKIHPIIAVVSTIVLPVIAKLADMFRSNSKRDAEREAQRESARQAVLNQVIPKVKIDVGQALNTIVRDNINKAKSTMESLMDERAKQVQVQLDQKQQDIQQSLAEQERRKQVYQADQSYLKKLTAQLTAH
ncbi:dynamin family protein [Moraxella sp. PS-22]|uniref:Dynamin family protein n=1 Tax=Moraxella tetraodonis TaxID=2767221 RepID=A0A9X1UQZ4_9GAMM|nr:dynamin family protein [Moraxella tetraodonis]MCG8147149.1 dynamin family protein [Moraxella tetraodonis]